ncbi:fimbrial adhesin YfcO [Escherichia coli]|uniref:Fimbrial adhesin YfcO n=1 Tax=Escherichia coli TaxID=562 RepID=A0A376W5Y0_ECOLX|nr:fimbrial adhesin YfcO [Escherichia coli]
MKIFRWLCCLVMLTCAAESLAAKKIATLVTPVAYSGYLTQIRYYLEILTLKGLSMAFISNTVLCFKLRI